MPKKKSKPRPVTGVAAINRVLGAITAWEVGEDKKDRGNPDAKHKRALNRIRDGRAGRVRFKVL